MSRRDRQFQFLAHGFDHPRRLVIDRDRAIARHDRTRMQPLDAKERFQPLPPFDGCAAVQIRVAGREENLDRAAPQFDGCVRVDTPIWIRRYVW